MKKIALIFVIFALLSINSKAQKQAFNGDNYVCNFETSHGFLVGRYISYYKNGKTKAVGNYEGNCRVGIWTVWDSTGRLRAQRDYKNLFCYDRIKPAIPKDKPIELLNTPKYTLKYNNDGYIESFFVKERMVVWSSRIWRIILPQDNPLLFENDMLFGIITKYLQNKGEMYTDEEFTKVLKIDSLNFNKQKIIAYKIKEDRFFDNERLLSEDRILGICPLVMNSETNEQTELAWIYFPDFRKALAQQKRLNKNIIPNIFTYDDLFFFRYFYGKIIKQSNVHDRPIAKYKFTSKEIDKEALRIEMDLIDTEHNLWISYTK